MALIDVLLSANANDLDNGLTTEMEIPRLTKKFGERFVLQLKAVSPQQYSDIQNQCMKFVKNKTEFDVQKFQGLIALAGITNKEFKDQAVLRHFGVETPLELFNKLFTYHEFASIVETIGNIGTEDLEGISETVKN